MSYSKMEEAEYCNMRDNMCDHESQDELPIIASRILESENETKK